MALGISVGWQKREECWLIRNSLRLFPESRSVRYTRHTHTHRSTCMQRWCTISWTISIYAHVRTWLRASNGWFASAKTCCGVCNLRVELVGTTRGRQRYYTTKRIQYILSFGIFFNNIHNRASTTCCATSSSEQEQQQQRISFRSQIFINVIWQAYEYCVCLQNLHMTQKQSTTTATQKLLNKRNY